MVFRPHTRDELCFVLMPFRSPFNGYYDRIIKPVAATVGLKALRSDEIYGTRPIIEDIWDSIWKARVVVADVTTKNPNVNYELGMCHALGVPAVLISKRIEDVPFDYRHRRCIVYNTDEAGWERKLFDELHKTLIVAINDPAPLDSLRWPYDTFDLSESRSLSAMSEEGRYAVLTFFLSQSNELLLVKHPFHGRRIPPGGRLKRGELPHIAVATRLKEETGIVDFEFHPKFHNPDLMISELVEDVPGPYTVHLEHRKQRGGVEFHYAFIYVCRFAGEETPLQDIEGYQPRWMTYEQIIQLPRGLIPFDDIILRYRDILRHLGEDVERRGISHPRRSKNQ